MGFKTRKYRNRRKNAANAGKSKSEPSSSSLLPTSPNSSVPKLFPEIMVDIFTRLPVKTLVNLKSVCVEWNSLISSQEFIQIHYNRFSHSPKTFSPNSQILESCRLGFNHSKKKKKSIPDMPSDFVLEICKGLVCISRPLSSDRIVLWNPATRLWKLVPVLVPRHRGNIDSTSVGFGCNEEGDDFKVVRIHSMGNTMNYVEVYSSKTDDWTTVEAGLRFRIMAISQSAEVRGHPHWLVYTEENEFVLLSFDSTKMLFKYIEAPPQTGTGIMTFVHLNGNVGALYHGERKIIDKINVLEHENDKWVNKWSIDCGDRLSGVELCQSYSWGKGRVIVRRSKSVSENDLEERYMRWLGTERGEIVHAQFTVYEESLAHVRGMAAMDLATPVAEGDYELNKCIADGFFTWVIPRKAGGVQVYYPLGC